jgi:hypothetical protein
MSKAVMPSYLRKEPGRVRSRVDLIGALAGHLLVAPLWLILTVGVGEYIPVSESASIAWVVGPLIFALVPLAWVALGVMLVVWWRDGRGPVSSYPFRWAGALFFTFFTLIALCVRPFRQWLTPPSVKRW